MRRSRVGRKKSEASLVKDQRRPWMPCQTQDLSNDDPMVASRSVRVHLTIKTTQCIRQRRGLRITAPMLVDVEFVA